MHIGKQRAVRDCEDGNDRNHEGENAAEREVLRPFGLSGDEIRRSTRALIIAA